MVMSLVGSVRGLTLIPAYVENLMPWSVVSRPLAGDVPTIDLAVGYKKLTILPC
jgi:LysR family hca operon transcriptional activator